jgi:hypothetical protein
VTRLSPPGTQLEAAAPESVLRSIARVSETIVANPIFAYAAIVLLQLRRIWDMWRYRDLTTGDTSFYYLDALRWIHDVRDNFAFSPMYTGFLAGVVEIIHDVYAAIVVHRILIVVAAAVLVLALMRSLLGPAIGLIVAVWWVVLPPNFDVDYEAHLFGVLPILVAALLASRVRRRSVLGASLAVLLAGAMLVRNELLIAWLIFAVAVVVREWRSRTTERVPIAVYLRAYVAPLLAVCMVSGIAYWRAVPPAWGIIEAKHRLNVCQVYAFNYQQRHPADFPGNPFTDCAPLMKRDFGVAMPTFLQATAANPAAIAHFVAWNARLSPSGMQVALFGATSTGDMPGYFPVSTYRSYALVLSLLIVGIGVAALATMSRDRRERIRKEWLRTRRWAIIVLGAVACSTIVVALTQRPRPEYMYGLTVGVMAVAGCCLSAVLDRASAGVYASIAALVLVVVLALVLPSYYQPATRPLHDAVERLQVIREQLQTPHAVLVAAEDGTEMCNYLARTAEQRCRAPSWLDLRAKIASGRAVRDVLDDAKATAIYVSPSLAQDPVIATVLTRPATVGWRKVAGGTAPDGAWSILVR